MLDGAADLYEERYGASSTILTDAKRESVDKNSWKTCKGKHGKVGPVVEYFPEVEGSSQLSKTSVSCMNIR